LAYEHNVFAITVDIVPPLTFQSSNFELNCVLVRQKSMFAVVGQGFLVNKPDKSSVDPFILSNIVGLCRNVVVEVGEDEILIVNFIDDLPRLLNRLDDEVDLIPQVFELANFDVDQVIFEHFFAPRWVLLDLLLQLDQLYGHFQVVLKVERLFLQVV